MRAVVVTAYGDVDVLETVERERPLPGAGEVAVRVEYAGVNYLDVQVRRGTYGIPVPFVAGFEGAGVVTEVGADVEELRPGQRVVWANVLGAYAEHAVVPAAQAVVVPDGVGLDTAVAVQVQGITAQYLVTDVHDVAAGQTVVVHAGAGGVGRLLVQLAKARGATVVATVSSAAKAGVARAAGADHVLGYAGLADAVRELTGGTGADVVYDGIGADTYEESARALRVRGTLVLYGEASGPVPPFDPGALGGRSLTVVRPSFGDYTADPDELRSRAAAVHAALAAGTLTVAVDTSLSLDQAAQAQRRLQERATTGKLALRVA